MSVMGMSQNWDMAYVVRDQKKSILEAQGIDVLNPRGRVVVKAVTMMTKTPPSAADQVISGGADAAGDRKEHGHVDGQVSGQSSL